LEKRGVVGQKAEPRQQAVRAAILARQDLFCRQGSVVGSLRKYRGRRLGPFFFLRWREGRWQRSLYLGRSVEVADEVKRLLSELQAEGRRKRQWSRLKQQARDYVRACKRCWRRDLARMRLKLKGSEIRGWRAAGKRSDGGMID
jgi:hypothetical protein